MPQEQTFHFLSNTQGGGVRERTCFFIPWVLLGLVAGPHYFPRPTLVALPVRRFGSFKLELNIQTSSLTYLSRPLFLHRCFRY